MVLPDGFTERRMKQLQIAKKNLELLKNGYRDRWINEQLQLYPNTEPATNENVIDKLDESVITTNNTNNNAINIDKYYNDVETYLLDLTKDKKTEEFIIDKIPDQYFQTISINLKIIDKKIREIMKPRTPKEDFIIKLYEILNELQKKNVINATPIFDFATEDPLTYENQKAIDRKNNITQTTNKFDTIRNDIKQFLTNNDALFTKKYYVELMKVFNLDMANINQSF